jgi:hypothetical protein
MPLVDAVEHEEQQWLVTTRRRRPLAESIAPAIRGLTESPGEALSHKFVNFVCGSVARGNPQRYRATFATLDPTGEPRADRPCLPVAFLAGNRHPRVVFRPSAQPLVEAVSRGSTLDKPATFGLPTDINRLTERRSGLRR